MHKVGATRHLPVARPFEEELVLTGNDLLRSACMYSVYRVAIHFRHQGPKPKSSNKLSKKEQSTRSNAFSLSKDKSIPDLLVRSKKVSVSLNKAKLEKIDLPGIEQV